MQLWSCLGNYVREVNVMTIPDDVHTLLLDKVRSLCKNKSLLINDTLLNVPLTSNTFGLTYIDLYYLLIALERCFSIKFNETDVIHYRFNSIIQIEKTIYSKLEHESFQDKCGAG